MVIDGEDIITVDQAAILLEVTAQHVRWLMRWGRIPARALGRQRFPLRTGVHSYLRRRALKGAPRRRTP